VKGNKLKKVIRFSAMAVVLAAIATLVSGSVLNTPAADAAALTNSPWCINRDSLAVVGTSTNTGYQTTGYTLPGPNAGYQPTTYGWYKRTTDQLNSYYGTADDGIPFDHYNYSRNGASTHNFLPGGAFDIFSGAKPLGTFNPNVLIVTFGTNEYLAQLPPATFQTRLNDFISNVYAATTATAILLVIQHEVGLNNPTYPWSQYASVIYNTAVAHQTALLDQRQVVPPSVYNGASPAGLYVSNEAPSKIHLSDAGHMVYRASYLRTLTAC
jgi:hypothetical protein